MSVEFEKKVCQCQINEKYIIFASYEKNSGSLRGGTYPLKDGQFPNTINKYSIDLSRLHYSLWLDLLDVLKKNIWR